MREIMSLAFIDELIKQGNLSNFIINHNNLNKILEKKAFKYNNKESKHKEMPSWLKTTRDLFAGGVAGGLSGLVVAPLATVADLAGTNAKSEGDAFFKMKPLAIAKKLYNQGAAAAGELGKSKIFGGIKEFYGGQGLKTFKMIPQNAINLAAFAGMVGAINHFYNKRKSDNK